MSDAGWSGFRTDDETRQALVNRIPSSLDGEQREQAERAINDAFDAIVAQDDQRLLAATLRAVAVRPASEHGQPGGGEAARMRNPWLGCERHCLDHLDQGHPDRYAVCYWACVIRESAE